jgi:hypothetical protein
MAKTYMNAGKWVDNPEPCPVWWQHPNEWLKWHPRIRWYDEPGFSSDDWNRMIKENLDSCDCIMNLTDRPKKGGADITK